MARVTDNGIVGMVGNAVFYSMNGKSYVRAKPKARKKKRNQPPNPLNTIFGKVSTYGSGMAKMMSKEFLFPFKLETYNRVRGWMRNQYVANQDKAEWILTSQSSDMCQLHGNADLRDFWKTTLTVKDSGKGKIIIEIPEFNPTKDVKVPVRTMKVNLKLIAVTSAFKKAEIPCTMCTTQYSFNYSNNPVPAQQFVLQTAAGTGDIAFVVVALEFEVAEKEKIFFNNELRWLPAAIVAIGKLT